MMYAADADAFNALNRAHADVDLDATALARYEPSASSAYEFGYARKTRAPNFYERYAWSTNWMASGMIGWFGDGNYYVGNVALKPEIAHTVSGTATWRDRARKQWEMKLAPYLTYIQSYVDVDTLATATYGMSTFAQLRFANHNARIYGGDLSGNGSLWSSARFGQGKISGVAGWLHGERLDTQTGALPDDAAQPSCGFRRGTEGTSMPDSAFRRWIENPTSIRIALSKSRRDTRSSICTRAISAAICWRTQPRTIC